MKKLTIVLLAFLFVGLGNVVAQTEATTDTKTEEVKKECPFTKTADGKLICVKTGKVCKDSCKNKAKGNCCKGKKKSCCKSKRKGCSGKYNKNSKNYSSGSNGGFNFNKKKCGEDCAKPCCVKEEASDDEASDDEASDDEASDDEASDDE